MSEVLPVCMREAKETGNPFFIELYAINLRTGITRIAACDENIRFNNEEYLAIPFKRGEITKSLDNITDACEISIGDVHDEHLKYLMDGFDFRGCEAEIVRIKYPDSLNNPNIIQWVFSGFIDEPSFSDGTFTCKLKQHIPNIECPNRTYCMACNSEFGDEDCGMSLQETLCAVQSVNGNSLRLNKSFPENKWVDGVATITGESRIITYSSGDMIDLNVNFAQNPIGKSISLIRGCNKTADRCKQYGNMKHFSGFPAIPYESAYR